MTTLYLIRHGQTVANVEHKISGQIETDLTPFGRDQILQTAQNLKSIGVSLDLILCSPLKRTKDSAQIIAEQIPAPIVYDDGLKEFSNGIYEGTKIEDLEQMSFNPPYRTAGYSFSNGTDLMAAYHSFSPKYDTFCYPKGETKLEARERFMNAIQKHLDANSNLQNVAVVAHGGVIRFMLLKICPEVLTEKIKNAEVRMIFYDKDKGFYA
ncbi:MAG: histidine phosphatase family protein [Alphaproteobacteria bacterium]|nr:histidine phosphatase family protein [Alphaproteobacteria bacterium]